MNDDTHGDFYVDEFGRYFETALNLLKFLQKHPQEYEIKLVYLVELDDCDNEGCTIAQTDAFIEVQQFDSQENASFKDFKTSFNILWDTAIPIVED